MVLQGFISSAQCLGTLTGMAISILAQLTCLGQATASCCCCHEPTLPSEAKLQSLTVHKQHLISVAFAVQAPAVRQGLFELHVMDFLLHEISLDAELQLAMAVPLSSTAASAASPAPRSPGPTAVMSAMDTKASSPQSPGMHASLIMAESDAASSRLDATSHKASFRKSSSRIRLPALPPDSTRSPKISARHPSQGPGRPFEAGPASPKLPPGFVSTGDLEEDMQQLMGIESQVWRL